jgi:hypothetical protein
MNADKKEVGRTGRSACLGVKIAWPFGLARAKGGPAGRPYPAWVNHTFHYGWAEKKKDWWMIGFMDQWANRRRLTGTALRALTPLE